MAFYFLMRKHDIFCTMQASSVARWKRERERDANRNTITYFRQYIVFNSANVMIIKWIKQLVTHRSKHRCRFPSVCCIISNARWQKSWINMIITRRFGTLHAPCTHYDSVHSLRFTIHCTRINNHVQHSDCLLLRATRSETPQLIAIARVT